MIACSALEQAMAKHCYLFGGDHNDGDASMKPLLGGKGANLAEMARLGLPVPPGFTLTTVVCNDFLRSGTLLEDLRAEVLLSLRHIEACTGQVFGDPSRPLLLSVRSGASASMPGMMDTILNLGINDPIAEGLAKTAKNICFAQDAYRRFLAMFGTVALAIPKEKFDRLLEPPRRRIANEMGLPTRLFNAEQLKQKVPDAMLTEADLRIVVQESKRIIEAESRAPFPEDPYVQLWIAIQAVFRSWNNDRAQTFRRIHQIPEEGGTACTLQAMVFGNLGDTSATGVAFTRDPRSGERRFFGEWLPGAQGEDVVAGSRTPFGITQSSGGKESLEARLPKIFSELEHTCRSLEQHYRDMMDIEFTVQEGKLFLLQCRVGTRSGRAQVRTAVEMVKEGLISREDALLRVDPSKLNELLRPILDPETPRTVLATGLPAGPGAASGKIVFDADEAERLASKGERVLLVRRETSPEDLHGMKAAVGILTSRGGATSHAAVVARSLGKCCIAGCSALQVDYQTQTVTISLAEQGRPRETLTLHAGDILTLSAEQTGQVLLGQIPLVSPKTSPEFNTLIHWADSFRKIKIYASIHSALDVRSARSFGADGLDFQCMESFFHGSQSIQALCQMLHAESTTEREQALASLLPPLRGALLDIFREAHETPLTLRLLEALPNLQSDQTTTRPLYLGALPSMDLRGARLALLYPELYALQARAIFQAACDAAEGGSPPSLEILVPFVSYRAEFEHVKSLLEHIATEISSKRNSSFFCTYGVSIDLPQAAFQVSQFTEVAQSLSLHTDHLTQATFGFSRQDARTLLAAAQKAHLTASDPFKDLDPNGIGDLIRLACERAFAACPNLQLSASGEHCEYLTNLVFFYQAGFRRISCSPLQIPSARLAAAQAAIAKS